MEYLTEVQGGYDEWSTEKEVICGVIFEDGTEVNSRTVNELFTDQDGNVVEVKLPNTTKIGDKLTLERYTETSGYQRTKVTTKQFNSVFDEKEKTVNWKQLND